ncbi:MAG: MBL fold metallo-hydrolase [Myxococcota bacterium]|nr:MBL fold metallo-hydrolase [Myxococcales bacterium]
MSAHRTRLAAFAVAAAALAATTSACALRDAIAARLVRRAVEANLRTSLLDDLPDGLHVGLCGAGSPLPDPERGGPCAVVVAGRRVFVVDAGANASRTLARMRVPQGAIEAVFLTHFHSDHIDGLGELMLQRWVNGNAAAPLPVHGPTGVERVVAGLREAYALDAGYRVAHHGEAVVPRAGAGGEARAFAEPPDGESAVLLDDGGVRVVAFRVDHAPVSPAVGYRFEYGGRAVAISGDTKRSANVERFARGVDVLVHEALAPRIVAWMTEAAEAAERPAVAKITRDILDYHTTPVEAAQSASAAGARHLLLTHVVPPLPISLLEGVFLEGVADAFDGGVTLGRDGVLASCATGGDEVEIRDLL